MNRRMRDAELAAAEACRPGSRPRWSRHARYRAVAAALPPAPRCPVHNLQTRGIEVFSWRHGHANIGSSWRECMGIEPTQPDVVRSRTVLKTVRATRLHPLPRASRKHETVLLTRDHSADLDAFGNQRK